jgi:hypothetical protein
VVAEIFEPRQAFARVGTPGGEDDGKDRAGVKDCDYYAGSKPRGKDMSDTLEASSTELRRLVDQYCATERNPSKTKFSVYGPMKKDDVWKHPASEKAGCYVVYGADGSWLYTGKSETQLGGRIANHLTERVQRSAFWQQQSPATYFDLIEVVEPWESLSLEGYLENKRSRSTASKF